MIITQELCCFALQNNDIATELRLSLYTYFTLITICSYNLSVRKSFVSLAEIIKTSKYQNSAWLCGFLEVPYLRLDKRLGFLNDKEVWVISVHKFLICLDKFDLVQNGTNLFCVRYTNRFSISYAFANREDK